MPDRLLPSLIRGARGMLDWSILDLAATAQVSASTIKRAESEVFEPVSAELQGQIRGAFERAGVHFLPDDGDGPGMRLLGDRRGKGPE